MEYPIQKVPEVSDLHIVGLDFFRFGLFRKTPDCFSPRSKATLPILCKNRNKLI